MIVGAGAELGKISDQFPYLEENGVLEVLMPKKTPIFLAKWYVNTRAKVCC
jgi:hypothetical protein